MQSGREITEPVQDMQSRTTARATKSSQPTSYCLDCRQLDPTTWVHRLVGRGVAQKNFLVTD